ncbi:MAG: serine hydroxymethyltransferase [Candidatus Thermoplasmatota archaeon]|nr:serine hydroxymethyltransferase [Candidatus Thermoplasmatota archaeon]
MPLDMPQNEDVRFIYDNVKKHTDWFRDSLCLIASENLVSPLARQLQVSDLTDRYAEGLPGKRYYQGNIYVDEIETRVEAIAKRLFRSPEADVRPISGTNANIAAFYALTEPGDLYAAPHLNDGAHISSAKFGAGGLRGANEITYLWDKENMNIDVDGTKKMLLEKRPKMCLFGRSVFLFPTPLKELSDTLQELGCHVWYDGAHVLGLIAGGRFQDPLREGAHIITGSTHKTLPGPQGGVILGNPRDDEQWKNIRRRVFPGTHSSHHLMTMAAKGIAFAEHIEFGSQYADRILKNARALAQALHERGFTVLGERLGFTRSHVMVLDVREQGGGASCALDLENANIISNKNLIPDDPGTSMRPSGLRLGVQELTRIGMVESNMSEVAQLMKRVLIDKEDPYKVKEDVIALKSNFQHIHFCLSKGIEAYRNWMIE